MLQSLRSLSLLLSIGVASIALLFHRATLASDEELFRSHWAEILASTDVDFMKKAVIECMRGKSQQGAPAAPCDTTANLVTSGFLPTGYLNPTLPKWYGTVVYAGGMFTFTGGAATGSTACIVTLTPNVSGTRVQWTFANPVPVVCDYRITGVGM